MIQTAHFLAEERSPGEWPVTGPERGCPENVSSIGSPGPSRGTQGRAGWWGRQFFRLHNVPENLFLPSPVPFL